MKTTAIETGSPVVWRKMRARGTVRSICRDTMTAEVVDAQGDAWTVSLEDLRPAP